MITTSQLAEMREIVKRAALTNYEPIGRISLTSRVEQHPDAQIVDGQWYYPIWGCDTLGAVIDRITGAICYLK